MSGGIDRTALDLRSIEDLSYLDALVDMAPRLMARADSPDSLTDFWRVTIKVLIAMAKGEAAGAPVSSSTAGGPKC